jgi:hypothetical protein
MAMLRINIGHPSYSGANRSAQHFKYSTALWDLLSRGVPMAKAHKALREALKGSHATCSRYSRGYAVETVEVVAINGN